MSTPAPVALESKPRTPLRLLTTGRFGGFWVSSLLSNIGFWAQAVAEPWLMLMLSGSPALVGLDAVAADAPGWALTLVGGALADRLDRRRVVLLFQGLQMLCPAALLALWLAHQLQPWMLILLSLIVGITDALSMPSVQASMPALVAHEEIASAVTLNSAQFNLSRVLGPALAGVLMARAGVEACFAVNVLSYLPFLLMAAFILPRRVATGPRTNDGPSMTEGLRHLLADPEARAPLTTVLVTSVFCGPLITFCPVLVRDAFHAQVGTFGTALSSFGVGGLLGALGLLALDGKFGPRPLSRLCAMAYALVVIVVAINPFISGLLALLALGGVLVNGSNISASSLLQSHVDDRERGQASSAMMLALRGGVSIGNLATGLSVSALGIRHALIINGAIALGLQLVLALRHRN